MSDFLKLVGEQLRIIRLSKGLSQEEVAERTGKLGFSKGRVSNIEHGQSNITLSTLETIMKALDITPLRSYLIFKNYLALLILRRKTSC